MKVIRLLLYTLLFCLYACMDFPDTPVLTQNRKAPSVLTDTIIDVKFTTATASGYIESNNGFEVSERGFLLDTQESMSNPDTVTCGSGKGEFTANISELKRGTEYFIKAYAKNQIGINYGRILSFKTETAVPDVYTGQVWPVSSNNQQIIAGLQRCTGGLVSIGEAPVEEIGICWGTSDDPELGKDNHKSLDSIVDINTPFSVIIDSIKGGKVYYARAYATNKYGTGYGESVSFSWPVWQRLEDFSGPSRVFAASFTLKENFYIVGGTEGDNTILQDTRLYNTDVKVLKWETRQDFPEKRKGMVSFVINNVAYVGLGVEKGGNFLNSFYRYDPALFEWRTTPQAVGKGIGASNYSIAFSLNNKGYVVDGIIYNALDPWNPWPSNKVWSCTIDKDSMIWTKMNPFPVSTERNIVFTYNNNAYVGLGIDQNNKRDLSLWQYNPNSDSWALFTTCPKEFVFGSSGTQVAATVTNDGKAYFMGDKQMWELDLLTKEWKAKSEIPGSYPGNYMFTNGSEVFVGINVNTNEFYRYWPGWDY